MEKKTFKAVMTKKMSILLRSISSLEKSLGTVRNAEDRKEVHSTIDVLQQRVMRVKYLLSQVQGMKKKIELSPNRESAIKRSILHIQSKKQEIKISVEEVALAIEEFERVYKCMPVKISKGMVSFAKTS